MLWIQSLCSTVIIWVWCSVLIHVPYVNMAPNKAKAKKKKKKDNTKTIIKNISFFKKLVGRLASTIACMPMTIIPHMMAYVSVFSELTWKTHYFLNLVTVWTVEVTSVVYTSNMCHGLCFLIVTFILYFSTFWL